MRTLWVTMVLAACSSPGSAPSRPLARNAEGTTAKPTPRTASAASAPAPIDACDGETFGAPLGIERVTEERLAKKRGTMGVAHRQMVVTSHPLATAAGLAVLRDGGTAADAFVAAVLVQDVVLPGVTSTAGLAGILAFDAKSKKLTYVHGGLADPIEPTARYRPGDTAIGKRVLVPGAPAAYAVLARQFGKKPFERLVEPAAKLAAEGFTLDALYAYAIAGNRTKLESSEYGKRTFFHDGKPYAKGETLKLDAFAKSLRNYGKDPTFFYRGAWPRDAAALIAKHGGALAARDIETYRVEVAEPLHGRFAGNDVYAAGHGGAKLIAALGALELLREGHAPEAPTQSASALEMLLRVQREAAILPMLHDRHLVDRGSSADTEVENAAREIATRVRASNVSAPVPTPGTHSSAVVVVDATGNVVVGTHTIETLNWGEGLFVAGIPLSTSAPVAFDDAVRADSRMRIDALTDTIVLRDGMPRAALAVYGTGLHPADLQVLDAVLARGVDAEAALLEPRVGYFQFDARTLALDTSKSVVDPRFDITLLCTLKHRGFTLERAMPGLPPGYVDTGFPTLITFTRKGTLAIEMHGMAPDPPFIDGVAAGD